MAFFVYLVSRVLAGIAGVVVLKYLIAYLDKEAYGDWGYVRTVGAAMIPIVSLSLPAAMMRMYFDRQADDTKGQAALITTVFLLNAVGVLVLVGGGLLLMGGIDYALGLNLLLGVTGQTFVRFFDYLARTRNNYFVFLFNRVVESLGFLVFMVILAGENPTEGQGLLYDSHLLSAIVAFSVCVWGIVCANLVFYIHARCLTWAVTWLTRTEVMELVKFSVPLSGTYFIGWLLSSSDIYLLKQLSTGSETGDYVFALGIASFVALITQSALTDWPRFFYALMRDNPSDCDERVSRRLLLFLGLHIGAIALLRLVAKMAYGLFDAEAYLTGIEAVNYLLLGNYFFLLGNLFGVGISHAKQTHLTFASFAIPGVLNIGLNLWLIPEHGAQAAALTTLVSFVVFAAISYVYGARFYRPKCMGRVVIYSIVATLVALTPVPGLG
jgi:O-antigen/teichoic acid export membrane protein